MKYAYLMLGFLAVLVGCVGTSVSPDSSVCYPVTIYPALGDSAQLEYDSTKRVVGLVFKRGGHVIMNYDANGNMISHTTVTYTYKSNTSWAS